jgi:hypothetical protein
MKRLNMMAMVLGTAGALWAGPASAQVEVEAGGTQVKVGKDGKVDVNAGGTRVRTGDGDTDVAAGDTRVKTRGGRASVKVGVDGGGADLQVRSAVKCVDNQELVLENIVVEGKGPVVEASGNCVLTLKDSVFKGKAIALLIQDNAEVTLINCTVQAPKAAVLSENATLKVQRSVVQGKTSTSDAAEIEKDAKSVFRKR